jgi:hypothetical protein
MGDVVAFRPQADRNPHRRSDMDGGAATILLFTGVRYERHDATPEAAAASPAPRKRRRRA